MEAEELPKWAYKLTKTINEHQTRPTYSVSFNTVDSTHKRLFASCGGRRITVYECRDAGETVPLQGYLDESEFEEYYVVKWTMQTATGAPILLAGGKQGVIRVLDCHRQTLIWTAVGHGEAVNDIAVHPLHPELFLSASKDCSLRLWNLKTRTCVLVAVGEGAHTNEVLSLDFHTVDGNRFCSSGMDDTVKIWWLKGHEKVINASFEFDASKGKPFPVGQLTAPIFSTHKVHWNYVDCVRWMGDLILSKSVDSRILMWQPLTDRSRSVTQASGPRYDVRGRVHLVQARFRVAQGGNSQPCLLSAEGTWPRLRRPALARRSFT